MGRGLPSSSVHGILQARILEWVAISFSRGSSQSRDQTRISCIGRQILYHWRSTGEAPITECYSAIKRITDVCNKLQGSSTKRMNNPQSLYYCILLFIHHSWDDKIIQMKSRLVKMSDGPGLGIGWGGQGVSVVAQWLRICPTHQCRIPGSGRFLGVENGNPLQYSCLRNPMDRGAWWATVFESDIFQESDMT